MSTTNAAESEKTASRTAIRRAVLGLVMIVAVMGSGVPLATGASAAPVRAPERCVNIVTCGPGQLPPSKVDPGPKPRPPALPAPKVVLTDRAAYSTPAGRWVRHELDVTNWQSYHPSLFAQAPQLPACGRNAKASRTWVDIYNAVNGHRIYGYCAIGKPEGLRDISFAVKSGEQAPSHIYVRLTDRQTRRTVTSSTVRIPPISEVTARYTTAERANMDVAARHWGIRRHELQKSGVMAVRFIHGIAGTTGSSPLRPRPEVSGPISYTSHWAPDEQHALDWVSDYYDLSYAETHKLGTAVMVFFAALDR